MRAAGSVRLARNVEPHDRRVALRLEHIPTVHTMGASGTALLEYRFYGCRVPHLYHHDRTHLGLEKQTPSERAIAQGMSPGCRVISMPRLGGLHHRYDLAA